MKNIVTGYAATQKTNKNKNRLIRYRHNHKDPQNKVDIFILHCWRHKNCQTTIANVLLPQQKKTLFPKMTTIKTTTSPAKIQGCINFVEGLFRHIEFFFLMFIQSDRHMGSGAKCFMLYGLHIFWINRGKPSSKIAYTLPFIHFISPPMVALDGHTLYGCKYSDT